MQAQSIAREFHPISRFIVKVPYVVPDSALCTYIHSLRESQLYAEQDCTVLDVLFLEENVSF